jgi:hypothetical protein
MAQVINFSSNGQQQQPIGGDVFRSELVKQLLENGQNKTPIRSPTELGLRIGTDALNAFTSSQLAKQGKERDQAKVNAIREFGKDTFGNPNQGNDSLSQNASLQDLDVTIKNNPVDPLINAVKDSNIVPAISKGDVMQRAGQILQAGDITANPGEAQNIAQAIEQENQAFSTDSKMQPAANALNPNGSSVALSPEKQALVQAVNPELAGMANQSSQFITNVGEAPPLRNTQPENRKLQQFDRLVDINPEAAMNFAIQNDPSRRQESIFSKPSIKDFTSDSVQRFQKTGNPGDLESVPNEQREPALSNLSKLLSELDTLPEGHPNRKFIEARIDKLNTSSPVAQINNSPESVQSFANKKFFEDVEKGEAVRVNKVLDQAQQSFEDLSRLDRLGALLDQVDTGTFAGLKTDVFAGLKSVGFNISQSTQNQVDAAQASRQIANEMALQLRNPDSGFGLTGNTSDRDLTFLKESIPSFKNTPGALSLMVETKRRLIKRRMDIGRIVKEAVEERASTGKRVDISKRIMEFRDANPLFDDLRERVKNTGQVAPGETSASNQEKLKGIFRQ